MEIVLNQGFINGLCSFPLVHTPNKEKWSKQEAPKQERKNLKYSKNKRIVDLQLF